MAPIAKDIYTMKLRTAVHNLVADVLAVLALGAFLIVLAWAGHP